MTLLVSSGKPQTTVPDVHNQPFDVAKVQLANNHLQPVRVNAFSDDVPAGSVIGTDPPGGKDVDEGSAVKVFVSKGPDLVVVPNVIGLPKNLAFQKIRAAGLVPKLRFFTFGSTVIDQSPKGGKAKRGSTVSLALNVF